MRIVLDTNVLIAAFIARGVCADLLEHCALHHTMVVSEPILAEFREHLTKKFKYTDQEAQDAVDLLRTQMEVVLPQPLDKPVCRDPDDDMVLATAASGNAECIVTGDKDLLIIRRYNNIEIVSPSQFADFETGRRS
jgi:putative PIN family toxin of toxin-antitoxin system